MGRGIGRAAELIERSEQLAELDQLLASVTETSRGCLVLIGGEAGVGKTALGRRFCDRRPEAVGALAGACDPLFTPRPLGPFQDVGAELAEAIDGARRAHAPGPEAIRKTAGRNSLPVDGSRRFACSIPPSPVESGGALRPGPGRPGHA